MFKTMRQLLSDGTADEIIGAMRLSLDKSDEAPFWSEKTLPYVEAILSALLPLRDQGLLFTPEGRPQEEMTPALLLSWCDLLSLKSLAFTLQKSNEQSKLVRTRYDEEHAKSYQLIDLDRLGSYLSSYTVNLENEAEDFPIAHYNLHIGITDVIRKLL